MKDRKSSFFHQLLWAATLAIGFGTLWLLLAGWILAAIDQAREAASGAVWQRFIVASDGTPLILSTPRDNLSLMTYRDLAGQPHDAPDSERQLPGLLSLAGEPGEPGFFADRSGWDGRLGVFVNEQEPKAVWYFVHDGKPEGGGYFVGYERDSNRLLGFIGLGGFRSEKVASDEWIPVRSRFMSGNAQWSSASAWAHSQPGWVVRNFRPNRGDLPPRLVHVPSGNRLYLVDLTARTISKVFEAPGSIDSLGIPVLSFQSPEEGRTTVEQPILVRTERQIHKLDHKYQITGGFTIPTEVDLQNPVTWYEVKEGQSLALFVLPAITQERSQIRPNVLYRIGNDGTVKDRFEVILDNGQLGLLQEPGTFAHGLLIPVPALLVAIEPLFLESMGRARGYPAALIAMFRDSWPSFLIVFALALALAVAARRRGRAFGLTARERMGWGVFVFLFGLPAYVGFLLSRRWPIRLPCPSCHTRAPRDRTECAACGAQFPDPPRKGIEIFA